MAIHKPLIFDSGIKQLPDGDALLITPESKTLNYSTGKLATVVTATTTKTFSYSSGKLSTITDSATGSTMTFGYTGSQLTSITVT